jgi:hypothetical protein
MRFRIYLATNPALLSANPAAPTKKPHKKEWGTRPHSFWRRVSDCNGLGGCPDLRLKAPLHSGGTVADFHGLPPSSQGCKIVADESKPWLDRVSTVRLSEVWRLRWALRGGVVKCNKPVRWYSRGISQRM